MPSGPKLMVLLVTAVVAILFIYFGFQAYPVPHGDAFAFIPPAMSHAAGHGLVNPAWDLTHEIDTTGQGRFLYYVPLFPLTLSFLMWRPDAQTALGVIGILNALSLMLSGWLFYKTATSGKKEFNWFSAVLVASGLLGLSTHFSDHLGGRPEILGTPWLLLGTLGMFYFHKKFWLCLPLGVLLGFMGATHPIGAVLSVILLALYGASSMKMKAWVLWMLGVGTLSALVFMGILYLSPYGLAETLQGTLHHARLESKLSALQKMPLTEALQIFRQFYFTNSNVTGYGFILLATLLCGAALVQQQRHKLASPVLFYSFSLLFLAAAFWTSIKISFSNYNLLMFSPLFYGLLIYYTTHCQFASSPVNRLLPLALAGLMFLSGTGFFRLLLLYPHFVQYGTPLKTAQTLYTEIDAKTPGNIGLSRSMWVLTSHYQHTYFWEKPMAKTGLFLPLNKTHPLIVQQSQIQVNSRPLLEAPSEFEGHARIAGHFCPRVPTLWGFKLAHTVPGYQFALYEPVPTQPAQRQSITFDEPRMTCR